MYAIFQSGGKQHRVIQGQSIRVERLNVAVGDIIKFNDVLMISNDDKLIIGFPFILNCVVEAEVITHGRGKKIRIIKFHRRKHYRKQAGHRQWFTEVKVTNIKI